MAVQISCNTRSYILQIKLLSRRAIVQDDRVLNWLRHNRITQPLNAREKLPLYTSQSTPSVFEAKLNPDFSRKTFIDKLHQLRNTAPTVDHF